MASVIDRYYTAWTGGFDEAELTSVLADDLDFEGPIAGKRRGSAGFIGGLRRFVEGLQAPIEVQQRIESNGGGAALYDAAMPEGRMRFAEFFQVSEGRIHAIRLLYDPNQYRALGGR